MKIFKIVWLIILFCSLGTYLVLRYSYFISGKTTFFDTVVFLVWIGIALSPLFNEINILGVRLKKDIDQLKKDFTHKISLMKLELKNSLEISSLIRNEILVNTNPIPINDAALPKIEEAVKKQLQELGIQIDKEHKESKDLIPKETIELFKIRYSLEQSIRTLGQLLGSESQKWFSSRLINELVKSDLLPVKIAHGVKEILAICNNATHGEKYSKAQYDFVIKTAPSILFGLEIEIMHYTNS